jgi:NAD(P)-dependent dehydrogenase (short-subunit alcohol dehydrogenase family)
VLGASRIALVTGGNKGIGLETCRQLTTKGLRVVLTARNTARGLEAVEAIRSSSAAAEVFFHRLDVTDPSSAARLADFIRGQFGRLDILVWIPNPFQLALLVREFGRVGIDSVERSLELHVLRVIC